MKIELNQQAINLPFLACELNDRCKPALKYVSFADGKAVATDGHKLAAIPCGPEKPKSYGQWIKAFESGLTSYRFLGSWKPFSLKKNEYATLDTEAKEILVAKFGPEGIPVKKILVETPSGDIQYPDYRKVLPNAKPVFRVALSVSVLSDLAKTLETGNNNGVVLEFSANGLSAIKVTGIEDRHNRTQGLIMPLRSGKETGLLKTEEKTEAVAA